LIQELESTSNKPSHFLEIDLIRSHRRRAKSDSLLRDQEAVCLQVVARAGFEPDLWVMRGTRPLRPTKTPEAERLFAEP
jgi:hypothetical protein